MFWIFNFESNSSSVMMFKIHFHWKLWDVQELFRNFVPERKNLIEKALSKVLSLFVFVLFINVSLRGSYLKWAFGSFSQVLKACIRLFWYFQKYVTDLYSSNNLIGKILCLISRSLEESYLFRLKQAFTAQLSCFSSQVIRFCDLPCKRIAGCCIWLKTRAFNNFRRNFWGRKDFTVYSVLIPQAIF